MTSLDIETLCQEAAAFSAAESNHAEKLLYGVTDGKKVGTYLEHKFKAHLRASYEFEAGSSARGIDFPGLRVDMKVTSIRKPQSSCPFKFARQKIYGLGYGLLVFVYDKVDDAATQTAKLNILKTIFVNEEQTADFQVTQGILRILSNGGSKDELIAFIGKKKLPVDPSEARSLAEEILSKPPQQGFLTISNALQWRSNYSRIVKCADEEEGVSLIYRKAV